MGSAAFLAGSVSGADLQGLGEWLGAIGVTRHLLPGHVRRCLRESGLSLRCWTGQSLGEYRRTPTFQALR